MQTKIKVRGFHLDVYQHVNNARYLEFLESEDKLDVELNYGQRGRPERRYHWRQVG